jgi:hypothetical protein
MTLLQALALAALAAGGWFVWDSLRAREAANAAMRRTCEAAGLLFLDDTVTLASVWPIRNDDGRLALRRVYAFGYSDTGHNRRHGSVAMVGASLTAVDIIAPGPQASAALTGGCGAAAINLKAAQRQRRGSVDLAAEQRALALNAPAITR